MGRGRTLLGCISCAKIRKKQRAWHCIRNARFLPATTALRPKCQLISQETGQGTREHTACLPGIAALPPSPSPVSQEENPNPAGASGPSLSSFHRPRWAEHDGTEAEGERIPSVPCAPNANTAISTTEMHNGFCLREKLIVAETFNYTVFL